MPALLLSALLAATPVTRPVEELRFNLPVDLALTGSVWAAWIASEAVFKSSLAPEACRWCDPGPVDLWARGIRAPLESQKAVDMASNIVGFGLLPLATIGLDATLAMQQASPSHAGEDTLAVLEAAGVALALNQIVKFSVGRQRPFVRDLSPEERAALHNASDNDLSFFSGHSTFAFAVAVASARVAQLRGYEHAWLLWAIGMPLAASVPLLRMVSDRHYLTDVLVGSAVGAAAGYALPAWLHPRSGVRSNVSLAAMPSGISLSGVF